MSGGIKSMVWPILAALVVSGGLAHAQPQDGEMLDLEATEATEAEAVASETEEGPGEESIGAEKEVLSVDVQYSGTWKGSLMFPVSDLRRLKEVITAYERRMRMPVVERIPGPVGPTQQPGFLEEGDDFLSRMLGAGEADPRTGSVQPPVRTPGSVRQQARVEKPEVIPSLYLNSITYLSPRQWVAWINGQRVGPEDKAENYQILDVDRNQLVVRFRVKELSRLDPMWREQVVVSTDRITADDPRLAEGMIHYHYGSSTFTLALRPNQTFTGKRMRIIEGRGFAVKPQVASADSPEGEKGEVSIGGDGGEVQIGEEEGAALMVPQMEVPDLTPEIGKDTGREAADHLMKQYLDFATGFSGKKVSPKARIQEAIGSGE